MTFQANPFVKTKVAAQRRAELQAETDRCRLRTLVQPDTDRRRQWPDLIAAVAVVASLALLLAGPAAAEEPPQQSQPGLVQADEQPDTNTVQKVREAAS